MVKTKIKRAVSFVMATVLSLSAFMSIGTSTAFAASGEKTNVYMVDFPRDGDANYDGVWGHSNLTLKNGWHTGSSTPLPILADPLVSVVRFSPGHFRRRTSRPVSYYALF